MSEITDRIMAKYLGEDYVIGSEHGKGYRSPTGEIDTRTAKPKFGPDDSGVSPASWLTNLKASFVDNPEKRIELFAKARGIPPDRYGEVDGEIVFVGDDGNLYRENPETIGSKAKQFTAQQTASLPEYALETVGLFTGGLPGAMAGAGAGQAIRKGIGNVVFDEPFDPAEWATDVGVSAGAAGIGNVAGRAIGGVGNEVGASFGGRLGRTLGRDRVSVSKSGPKIMRAKDLFDEYGIAPTAMELTNSNQLASIWSFLGDLPATADLVDSVRQGRVTDIKDLFRNFLETAGNPRTKQGAGKALVDAANETLGGMRKVRSKTTGKMYEKAFEEAGPIDITPVLDRIDEISATLSPRQAKRLSAWKDQFMKTVEGPDGEDIVAPQDILQNLDNVKKDMDKQIRLTDSPMSGSKDSVDVSINHHLKTIKRELNDILETASPEYAKAKKTHQLMDPAIKRAEQSAVGDITSLEGEETAKAVSKLLSTKDITPAQITARRELIERADPHGRQAWKDGVRAHLADLFHEQEKRVLASGAERNVGGNMAAKVSLEGIDNLAAAMDPVQAKGFRDIMEIMERTGRLFWRDSGTAARQEANKKLFSAKGQGVMDFFAEPRKKLAEMYRVGASEEKQQALFDALANPKAVERLAKIKQMSNVGMKRFQALTQWWASYIGGSVTQPDRQGIGDMFQSH